MRLSVFAKRARPSYLFSRNLTFPNFYTSFILFGSIFGVYTSASTDTLRSSNLLPTHRSGAQNTHGENGEIFQPHSQLSLSTGGFGRSLMKQQQQQRQMQYVGVRERIERAQKHTFRLELLRQIKAIDHMKCFPKVLCGLSVDSDKSFGINKSNFVRSYLELMRNIKPPKNGVVERFRTEDEIEDDLLWPFSPHNPDRKLHSSFDGVSSAGMSASVEVPDSLEYLRGIDSMEKADRRGGVVGSVESKDKSESTDSSSMSSSSSHSAVSNMESSKIPGEMKKKKNSNKSLTSKLTSYFTSWLPEISFGMERRDPVETELGFDMEGTRGMTNDGAFKTAHISMNDNIQLPDDPVLHSLIIRSREGRAANNNDAAEASPNQAGARDDIQSDSAEHDADIYHTAVNIGKRLKDPKQCDYIYNGCPLEYSNIMRMISSIKSEIKQDDTAEQVSHELGLELTTTTTTTTTKRPPRRKGKPRPSTKIMHVLPNGEKVEINFRLAGKEDSEESSAQRDFEKKEFSSDETLETDTKGSGEVTVVDLDDQAPFSSEEFSSDTKSSRKGTPPGMVLLRKSNKKKTTHFNTKGDTSVNEEMIRSEGLDFDEDASKTAPAASSGHTMQFNPTFKLNGLSLSTGSDDQPLEISPSYVIIKHQPLSVHTTSLLTPDTMQSPSMQRNDNLQAFQLIQGGQKLDPDHITDHLKNYIRNGGLIPKLSLHSSGLITTDSGDSATNPQNPFSFLHHQHQPSFSDITSSISQKTDESFSNPLASLSLEPAKSILPKFSHIPNSASYSITPYSNGYVWSTNKGPTMVGAVPGRLSSFLKPPSTTTTTTSTTTTTTSTTTENIIMPGMAETVTLDTDEITDDTMDKMSSPDNVPGWLKPSLLANSQESSGSVESDKSSSTSMEESLENLHKNYLDGSKGSSKIRYKNPKKKKTRVKANSSRVRNSNKKGNNSRNKGTKGDKDSDERVVIKHAGPYGSSPTVYNSPLQGPGPHNGAYPYLPGVSGMKPSVFPGLPFWRL